MKPVLQVEDLTVRFRTDDGDVYAVTDVSFELQQGQVLSLVGESGCGKSVTAMSLLGLLPKTAEIGGRIIFGDQDLLHLPEAEMRSVRGKDISMVFQEPMTSLNPVFTVGRQVGEVLRRHENMSKQAARRRAVELLDLVGIPAPERRIDEYPHQLSGGMRQRVMIAMAVACNPKILIADEPTTALDVTIQAGILDVMRDLRDQLGSAVLLITHDLGVVADVAERVVVMYAGRKVEEASVDELFAQPQHPYTLGLMGAMPRLGMTQDLSSNGERRLQEIPGLVPSLEAPPSACPFAPRCPRADDRTRSELPKLENIRPDHLVACFHPGPDLEETRSL
jgi:peptide/nickel transport system ATP-binding protein